jgi:hypothetical protein
VSTLDHQELKALIVVNHSCAPNVGLVLPSKQTKQWGVEALKDIKEGEDLTFFYPSTEWDMAQGFDCSCGAKVSLDRGIIGIGTDMQTCLGKIAGAKHISLEELEQRGGLSDHIRTLKQQQ